MNESRKDQDESDSLPWDYGHQFRTTVDDRTNLKTYVKKIQRVEL